MILSNFHAFIWVFESLGIRNVPLVWVEIVFIKQLWYHEIPCVFSLHINL